jgi:alpha,alpha-trehalose phosphorylase
VDKTHFHEQEIGDWKATAERIYIPYNRELGLYPQDDSFFDKAVWDFDGTPADNYPLLLYYHPLTIYRYQILKQPDLILGMFLQGNLFSQEEKRRNFDYYDALTTGDSSLSPCIQAISASEVGYVELAYEYFMKTSRMDLDDINGNVRDGVHTAAMAGSWLSLVYGFAGMRDFNGIVTFNPHLPGEWTRLSFRLIVRGSLFNVDISQTETRYELLEGPPLTVYHGETEVSLDHGTPVTCPVALRRRGQAPAHERNGNGKPIGLRRHSSAGKSA